ncbi:ABC transporter ATP-binding protein [Actinomadura fibrosa]|uniref:Spermidine/putrescine import ATP-binding protein PotA n=1 Tax=Actinomadura fibrosa TaxID=111802 RepID=A0ABW2XXX1_9ACTN|nr:ABC transporter ATP-binding protein [Actinomadura fibrosa]
MAAAVERDLPLTGAPPAGPPAADAPPAGAEAAGAAAGHVEIEGLAAGYDGHRVLDLDRLSVRRGEFLSILGPSGCGKTTLLNAIAGFVAPDTGRILVDGADITGLPPHRRELGMVFQNYALFPHLSVAGNVAYGLRVHRVPKRERAERVAEALRLVGLEEFAGRRPRALSGGQQQRVAIARALATRPAVLLLDEPLSNLDAKLRREMRVELRKIQRSVGTTMVFVTHDQEEALSLSDRIAVLNGGRLEQLGTPDEVYRRPASRFVAQFIGAANVLEGTVRDDGSLDVGGAAVATGLPDPVPGREAVVAVRPERIRLSPAAGAAGPAAGVTGTVSYRAFTGDAWQVEVRTAGGLVLTVRVADSGAGGADPPGTGTAVTASWDPADLIVLEPGAGR